MSLICVVEENRKVLMWILQPVLWRFLDLRSDTNARLTADVNIGC